MASQYGDDGVAIDNDTGEVLALEPTSGLQPIIAAEINQAIATAHAWPRRRDRDIINEIVGRASLDETTAAECSYSLKRGDKMLNGPSIRFAEVVRASFGNMRVASRFVALDVSDPERAAVLVEAVALDLETNQSEVIPNRRSVMTSGKGGRKAQMYSADMINMTVNAAISIARRNAILAVVPKPLWLPGYDRVMKVLQGDADTLGARREKMMAAFGHVEATPEMVFAALGVTDLHDIKVSHMPVMIGMLTAIKDGESVDSVMGRMGVTEVPRHQVVKNPLRDDPKDAVSGSEGSRGEVAAPQEEATQRDTKAAAANRGSSTAAASADLVIDENGQVVKNHDGSVPPQTIIDERFLKADEFFKGVEGWEAACRESDLKTDFGFGWQKKQPDEKSDRISSGTGPTQERQEERGDDAKPKQDAAKPKGQAAAPAGGKAAPSGVPYDSSESYMEHIRDRLDAASTKAAVTELWGSTRADRNELLGADEIDALTKDKDAAVARIAAKGKV